MKPGSVSARVPGASRLVDLCSENIHFILGPRNRGLIVFETDKQTDRQTVYFPRLGDGFVDEGPGVRARVQSPEGGRPKALICAENIGE